MDNSKKHREPRLELELEAVHDAHQLRFRRELGEFNLPVRELLLKVRHLQPAIKARCNQIRCSEMDALARMIK